ncbi:radical SAM protein, partial [Corynebacterium sp. CCM 8862]|nr:radical SAM protein [Corynebacterium mendelii]
MPATAIPQLPAAGIIPFSVTDWPDNITATLFTQGCPWRCRYCHNPALQEMVPPAGCGSSEHSTGPADATTAPRPCFADFLALLRHRRRVYDGAVISGGEPTVHRGLGAAVAAIHGLGLPVGLHTCGYQPTRLEALLANPVTRPEWVGLDVKAITADLPQVVGCSKKAAEVAGRSLDIVSRYCRNTAMEAEIRTTIWPDSPVSDHLDQLREVVARAGFELVVHQAHGVDANGYFIGDSAPVA